MRKLSVVLLMLCAGCISGITKVNQDRYYQTAVTAQSRGDWNSARRAWARVVANSRSSGATTNQQAVYHYEYGRSLGVTCFFDEAERELLEAYRLDVETEGPAYMSLHELARLNLGQGKFAEAATYFEHMLNDANEKELKQAPSEHANILDEYARALTETGNVAQALLEQEKAEKIRALHPQAGSITERTPYGSQCR